MTMIKENCRINIDENDVIALYDAFVSLCDYIEMDTGMGCINCPLSKKICFNKDKNEGNKFAQTLNRIKEIKLRHYNCKIDALKILGYHYITRDIDRRLFAWMDKPIRVVYASKEKEEEIKEKFGTEINYIEEEYLLEDHYEYKDGYNVDLSGFAHTDLCAPYYARIELDFNDNSFKDITWENSPLEIQ